MAKFSFNLSLMASLARLGSGLVRQHGRLLLRQQAVGALRAATIATSGKNKDTATVVEQTTTPQRNTTHKKVFGIFAFFIIFTLLTLRFIDEKIKKIMKKGKEFLRALLGIDVKYNNCKCLSNLSELILNYIYNFTGNLRLSNFTVVCNGGGELVW